MSAHTLLRGSRPSDTFYKDYEVNVVSTSNGNRAVTLDRVATKLKLTVTDEVKAECAEVAVEPVAWYYGWDYVNGAPARSRRRVVAVPANLVGSGTVGGGDIWTKWQYRMDYGRDGEREDSRACGDWYGDDGVPFKANRT